MYTHQYLVGPNTNAEFSLHSHEGVVGDGQVDVVDEDAQHLGQRERLSVATSEEDSELRGDERERCSERRGKLPERAAC